MENEYHIWIKFPPSFPVTRIANKKTSRWAGIMPNEPLKIKKRDEDSNRVINVHISNETLAGSREQLLTERDHYMMIRYGAGNIIIE